MAWLKRLGLAVCLIGMVVGLTTAAPIGQTVPAEVFELNLRADLDLLAGVVFGEAGLPETWTGNNNRVTPNYIADLFFDNEQLANRVFGDGVRPEGWFGASSPSRELVTRNLRHDLEQTATFYYAGNTRPEGWAGAPARYRCDRVLQTLLLVLARDYNRVPTTIEGVLNYCAVLLAEIEDTIYTSLLPTAGRALLDSDVVGGLRGDLERLADERLGLETRPPGWIGNRNENSPSFINDVFIDLGRLADNQLGAGNRPEGWNGALSTSQVSSVRRLRIDIELLADATLGEGVSRPTGWQGTDPLARCDATLQTLIVLVEARAGTTRADIEADDPDYCEKAQNAVVQFAENPLTPVVDEEGGGSTVDSRLLFKSRNAFAYLDVAALQYMGAMPYDIEFRPWFRNFQDSNMMFVTGPNFAVFIDRRWTTMPEEVFRLLPNLEDRKPLTFCDATWCNGPGPTPTPTGSGPIIEILNAGTPAPTSVSPITGPVPTNKTQVTWSYIRVTYLFDNPATQTVQVALEICAETAQISCEGVISVYSGVTNSYKPILQQYNGLNVFEFGYGYQTSVLIEGPTRYSRDIFISEPGLRSALATATPTTAAP
jgi:hypothetical protein